MTNPGPVGDNEYEDDDEEINLDAELTNADWTKQTWDLPVDASELKRVVPDATKLLDLPAGADMPRRLRSGLENERAVSKVRVRRENAATLGAIKRKDRYRD